MYDTPIKMFTWIENMFYTSNYTKKIKILNTK